MLAPVLAFAFPFLRLKAISILFFFAPKRGKLTITMKPHPRMSKTVKRGGALVSVLLLVVWLASARWGQTWYLTGGWSDSYLRIQDGRLDIGAMDVRALLSTNLRPTTHIGPVERPGFKWWFYWRSDSIDTYFGVPLWIPAVLMLTAVACAWRVETRFRRRSRLGCCPQCNYDRTGLAPGAPCPECGKRPA